MKVPVAPMRRLTFYFEIREKLEKLPLTRHISRNVSFRLQGAGYISGNTRYDEPPGFNWEITIPISMRRSGRGWPSAPGLRSAQYDQRLGRSLRPEQLRQQRSSAPGPTGWRISISRSFSGHGLMQAPAVGRGLSELLLHGRYQHWTCRASATGAS
jgi:hypothetical protein